MPISRRQLLSGALAVPAALAQRPLDPEPKVRTRPLVCLCSQYLQKLHYTELGPVLLNVGFEGCDLTVRPGGHVAPNQCQVDLLRAVEEIRGAGVEVPMMTTALTSPSDPWVRPVIGIAGGMNVTLFRSGVWKYTGGGIDQRVGEVRRDIAGLGSIGRAYGMAMGVPNESGGNFGAAVWDIRAAIDGLDPRWVGYCFDPCHATVEGGGGGWKVALRLALPRLKMLTVRDFYWAKEGGAWTVRMCPLGEGMVDWPAIFGLLAESRFTGPVSLHLDYRVADELTALSRDLEFVKRHLTRAYGPVS
jgi:L-ribulose-5-phosphate 3-epimerase